MSSKGAAVIEDQAPGAAVNSVALRISLKPGIAGSISGEWKAPATGRRIALAPSARSALRAFAHLLGVAGEDHLAGVLSLAIVSSILPATFWIDLGIHRAEA